MGILDVPLPSRLQAEALNATFALKSAVPLPTDRGERAMSALDLTLGDLKVGIAGDSTGNEALEWADLLLAKLGTRYPSWTVEIPHWNDTTQAYSAAAVVQTGTTPAPGIIFQDTFTRTASELYGTLPDLGGAWGRDGSNMLGDWTLDGSSAVATGDATAGAAVADGQLAGNLQATSNITMSTEARGVATQWRLLHLYKDVSANYVWVQVNVSTSGQVNAYLYKRIANVSTQLGTLTNPIAPATAAVTFDVSLKMEGAAISATVNGQVMSATLTGSDVTALTGYTMAGFTAGAKAGDKVNEFKIEMLTSASAPKLTFYNASMSGSVLTYQQTRLATMYPVPLDLLFISAGHNYGTDSPAAFTAKLDSFINDFRAVQPTAGIVITSQNPQKPPASGRVAHLQRQAVLRSYAAMRGYGYLEVVEMWLKQAGGGQSLVAVDGVHPTQGATATGSSLWRDVAYDYLLERSV